MKNYILPLLLLLSLGIAACRKCEDPCLKKSNAEFVIESELSGRWFAADTQFNTFVRFRALHEADSFVWQLGIETIRGNSFIRLGFPEGTFVPVRCIAYRQPQPECDSNDDGIDTFMRSFWVWESRPDVPDPANYQWNQIPVFGYYKGHIASRPNQEIIIHLNDSLVYEDFDIANPNNCGTFINNRQAIDFVENVPYPGLSNRDMWSVYQDWIVNASPTALYINCYEMHRCGNPNWVTFPAIKGYAWLETDRRHIQMEYSYRDTLTGVWLDDKFSGVKVYE